MTPATKLLYTGNMTSGMTLHVLSVNVGKSEHIAGYEKPTGILKRPQAGAVRLGREGLAGDHVIDTRYHGGADQAVYIYTAPDYAAWEPYIGKVEAGTFGENLLVTNLESAQVPLGSRLTFNEVVLEVTAPRIPCRTLAARMNDQKFVKLFTQVARPGFYARVLTEGHISAGESFTFEAAEFPTIGEAFAVSVQRKPAPELLRRMQAAPLGVRFAEEVAEKLLKFEG